MGKTASLDIETFCPVEVLDEEDVSYLKSRKNYASEESFYRDLATNPYVAMVVSFSFFMPEEKRAYAFYLGEEDAEEVSRIRVGNDNLEAVYICISSKPGLFEAERRLIGLFWEHFEKIDTLLTFHGKDFDMEFLKIRTLIHEIKAHSFYRYFHSKGVNHIDLKDLLKVGKSNYSLNFISKRFKLPVDKGDMDGSKVRDAFLKREYKSIAEYNLRDAVLTGLLYERVKHYLYENYVLELLQSAGFSESRELIKYALDNGILSKKEASMLIDIYSSKVGPTDKQAESLYSMIEDYDPDLKNICFLLSHETLHKIVNRCSEEELT